MEKIPQTFRCSGFPDVRCECGGQLAVGGEGYVQLPTGFGFAGSKFVVDAKRYPAYSGFCLKCSKSGMFVRTDKQPKAVRKIPRKINRKIARTSK
jgi:hypothetical protein